MPITFKNYAPTTLEEAVAILVDNIDDVERDYIRQKGVDGLHHFFGMALRNGWELWRKDTPLVQFFRNHYGIGHADDMSGMILDALKANVMGEEFNAAEEAIRYRRFWTEQNLDPLKL